MPVTRKGLAPFKSQPRYLSLRKPWSWETITETVNSWRPRQPRQDPLRSKYNLLVPQVEVHLLSSLEVEVAGELEITWGVGDAPNGPEASRALGPGCGWT